MDESSILHRQFRVSPETAAITQSFYAWEYRLRGYDLYEYPVHPEPVYMPLYDIQAPLAPLGDDARRETLLSRLGASVKALFEERPQEATPTPVDTNEASEPHLYVPDIDIVEIQIALPKDTAYPPNQFAHMLSALKGLRHPLSYELIGTPTHIAVQCTCRAVDATIVQSQLRSHFPEAVMTTQPHYLESQWSEGYGDAISIVDFGLSDICGLSLNTDTTRTNDPYISLIAALETVSEYECAVIQVLFCPVEAYWNSALVLALSDGNGSCIFADDAGLLRTTHEKTREPLFAVSLRIGTKSAHTDSARALMQRLGSALGQYDNPTGNSLIPLSNEQYPDRVHEADLLYRLTHRTGMLLSRSELSALVHLPSPQIVSPRLLRADQRTKACPWNVRGHALTLGINIHQSEEHDVSLSEEQRMRHTYVVGASGTGKSTLLLNLITQDMEQGEGFALLDPHGDLTAEVVSRVPEHRRKDVIIIDPSDEDFPIGFNIFHARSEAEKTLLASDLTTTFKRLSTSWGDRMHTILANGIIAMVEHPEGGTLLTLRRFLSDNAFRRTHLAAITDPEIRYYWEQEYPKLSRGAEAPVLTRLDTFLRTKTIRNMVAQSKSGIDFGEVMDGRKILLVKLSHGAIGEENAYLLGTLMVTAIHQAALRRQSVAQEERTPFYLYIDEFQNFITPSMEAILSGARKYNLGLILAHQERRQLLSKDREVASSVLSNPYTRICFRLGYDDAHTLAKGLVYFNQDDLQNLGIGEAIVRTEQAQYDFNLSVPWVEHTKPDPEVTEGIYEYSRQTYGTAREEVETSLKKFYERHETKKESPPQPQPVPEPNSESTPKPSKVDTAPTVPKAPKPSPPGRGGSQHSYLQNLIKKYAEERGFKATIEDSVLSGTGFVDLSLQLGKTKIACEISVTNTAEYEHGNIQKCLAAGYDHVVLLCQHKRKRGTLEKEAKKRLEPSLIDKVQFLEPDGFLAFIDEIATKQSRPSKTVRGYKVSTNYVATDSDERKAKSEAVARLIANSINRL